MREQKFLAGLGTVIVFVGIFCFKALVYKKILVEGTEISTPLKNSQKVVLILAGILCVALGLSLILRALKLLWNNFCLRFDQDRNLIKTNISPVQENVSHDYTYSINNDWTKKITKLTNRSIETNAQKSQSLQNER